MSKTQPITAGKVQGIILVLASIMPAMAVISLVPVMPLLGKEFADTPGSQAMLPIALTIPALCVALFSPLAGWLSDRIGRKGLLVTALFAYAAIGVIPYFLTDLKQIIAARVGLGIFEAVIMTVATAMIGDYFKDKEREKWIGIQIGVVSLSAIILIALGGALGEALGSRGPFLLYLLAIPVAIWGALKLFDAQSIEKVSDAPASMPWKAILPLLVITLIVGILFYTTIVKMGEILQLVSEVSPGLIGGVGAIFNLGVMVAAASFVKIKSKYSGPILLAMGMALFAIGYGGMGLSGSLPVTVIFSVVTSLGAGLLLPTSLALIMNILPSESRGRGTGFWTGMFYLGQFAAPLVAMAFVTSLGGLANVLIGYGTVAALFMVMALFASRGAEKL